VNPRQARVETEGIFRSQSKRDDLVKAVLLPVGAFTVLYARAIQTLPELESSVSGCHRKPIPRGERPGDAQAVVVRGLRTECRGLPEKVSVPADPA
jgi:hypothetical protein